MTDIDEAIRRAMSEEDARALDAFAPEESLFRQALATMGGTHRGANIMGWLAGFGMLGIALWSGFRFIGAPDLREMILWGAITGTAIFALGMIKVWFWMEMQRNATVREIKRVELQVARLAARQAR